VTYTEAPCGSVNEIIVVNSPPVINEDFIPSATTCANDPSGQIVNSSFITGGTAPFTYDWDYADVPGNEIYPDDGNTFFPHGLNGVLSGFYDFIVTDALGCSDVATVFVPEGDPVTATFQIDPILCFGGMTGGIQITSSNGPPVSGI
jgi:large repetitive protein